MSQAIQFDPIRLPDAAEDLRSEVRAFLAENSDHMDRPSRRGFDHEFSRKVAAKGWIGLTWPKEYGGQERSFLERYVITEEFLVARAPSQVYFTADRQSGPVILKYGDEALKHEVLPRIIAGECTFAIGMSEPDSGSDLFAAKARAERTNEGWRLNGTKVWTTAAHEADYMIGLFRTSPPTKENRRHGLTQFLVDMKKPGINVRPIYWPNGDHDFNEVVFEDVDMPANHLLGEEDNAWAQATAELAYERSGPERFLETIAVLIELVNLVGPTPDARAAEGLGRLVAQLFTMRRMSISVAGMLAAGKEPVLEASIVKDLGTVWMQKMPGICRDLGSLIDSDPATRSRFETALTNNLLIAPKLTIQGGTTEILRGIIARGLGLR
jgi:alkylation response protein AidB-like acyl-CoA dehydrogenase